MSHERLAQNPPDDTSPLESRAGTGGRSPFAQRHRSGSGGQTDRLLQSKRAGVLDRPYETQIVEVLRLTTGGTQNVATYGMGETVVSLTFPDLNIPVAEVFAE